MKERIIGLGEIMLRLSPPNHERLLQSPLLQTTFGGGESNVMISLAQFGLDTAFVTALPTNPVGEECVRFLRSFGVDVSSVERIDARMGIYYLETGANQRLTQAFYDRTDSAIAVVSPDQFDWDEIFADAKWLHITGILPSLSQTAADISLAAVMAAHERGLTISCGTSYRSKLWQYGKQPIDIMPQIAEFANILFANEFDSRFSYGVAIDDSPIEEYPSHDRIKQVGESLFDQYTNLTHLIMTHRERVNTSHNRWYATLYNGYEVLESQKYDITHIVDRVGGGDAFAAGIIYGLATNMCDLKTLNFATAATCLKHSIPGDINRVTVKDVMSLMNSNGVDRVQR